MQQRIHLSNRGIRFHLFTLWKLFPRICPTIAIAQEGGEEPLILFVDERHCREQNGILLFPGLSLPA